MIIAEATEIHYELNPEMLDEIVANLRHQGSRRERRRSSRQQFPVMQLMAPFHRKMPRADQFTAVSCRDLSSSGIAFYLPERANFTKVVIGLGKAPQITYVAARVVRQAARTSGGGVVVGCEFVDRVGIS